MRFRPRRWIAAAALALDRRRADRSHSRSTGSPIVVAFFANAVTEPMAAFENRIGRLGRAVVDALER